MGFLGLFGRVLIVQEELQRAHEFIRENNLPVEIFYNDFHKQMIALENYAGTDYFQKGLTKYKRVNTPLVSIAFIIIVPLMVASGLDYIQPQLGLVDSIFKLILIEDFTSKILYGTVFAIIIVLCLMRAYYAKALEGKVLEQAWQSIWQHTETEQRAKAEHS
ncbi:hypothetical protein SAMN04487970_105529 [Paenibacillus tianmuensis]|uniref:Uncharacterized protein n=1 Tax=Paenibacillus tianmuensis TaxID=624147 RepID=A0A1G4TKA4_9BACL|nr:DUF6097 family protein [Paenibacillus tianmuensis]SCW81796.1 hypothetical protein SAMN04487970_105529 [Paenibacillus tianmuensis]